MNLKEIFKSKDIEDLSYFRPSNLLDLKIYPAYGKKYGNIYIEPIKSSLKQFPNTNFSAINFVVDSYMSLYNDIKKSCFEGKISKTSMFNISNLSINKAYVSPLSCYDNILNTIFSDFFKFYKNIDSCVNFFDSFYQFVLNNNIDFTIYSCLETFYIDIFSSGLAISFLSPDIDYFDFFKDQNYPYFNHLCKRYNFMISKDKPNILIFKLNKDYSYVDYQDINNTYISYLNNVFKTYWNKYVNTFSEKIEFKDKNFCIDLYKFYIFLLKCRFNEISRIENINITNISEFYKLYSILGYSKTMNLLNTARETKTIPLMTGLDDQG